MEWHWTLVVVADVVAAVIMCALAFFAWRHRDARGATPFAIAMWLTSWWMLTNALYLNGSDVSQQLLWRRMLFLGVSIAQFALTVSAICWTYGIFRCRLFDVVPAAHHTVLANLPDGLIVLDARGHIAEINPLAAGILNTSAAEASGRRLADVLPEWPDLFAQLANVTHHEVTITLGQAETHRHLGLRMSPVLSRHGLIAGHVVVLRDVTQRTQLETALRQRTAQLGALSRVVLELSSELELDALLRFITEQAAQLVGGTGGGLALLRPEHDALEWLVSVGMDTVAPARGTLIRRGDGMTGKVWETGQPLLVDDYSEWPGRFDRLAGAPHRGAVAAVPLRRGAEILGVVGVAAATRALSATDVDLLSLFAAHAGIAIRNTQLVQSLRDSEQRYRELADALPDAVFEVDRRGMLTFVNRQGLEMFGYTATDLAVGTHVLRLLTPDDRRRARSVLEAAVSNRKLTAEYTGRRKGGATFPVLVHLIPVLSDGRVTGLRGIAMDITGRRQMEGQIQASLKEKEMLLREIHHRVKNNLQVISSLLYLQSDTVQDAQARHSLAESQQRVRSLGLLHEQMYQSSQLATVNFGSYIDGLAHQLRDVYLVRSRPIGLAIEVDDVALGFDVAIPCSLIINELVSNALKHAFPDAGPGTDRRQRPGNTADAPGHPEVRVGFGAQADGQYVLTVSDNGIGLPEEMSIETTGSLGLRIVRLLTRQLRGKLAVDRREGTTFTVTFPRGKQAQRERIT